MLPIVFVKVIAMATVIVITIDEKKKKKETLVYYIFLEDFHYAAYFCLYFNLYGN